MCVGTCVPSGQLGACSRRQLPCFAAPRGAAVRVAVLFPRHLPLYPALFSATITVSPFGAESWQGAKCAASGRGADRWVPMQRINGCTYHHAACEAWQATLCLLRPPFPCLPFLQTVCQLRLSALVREQRRASPSSTGFSVLVRYGNMLIRCERTGGKTAIRGA